ncbi:ABC transporter permease [Marinactinospora endophytica]
MTSEAHTLRIGITRGWIEFRQTLRTPSDLASYLLNSVIMLVILSFLDRNEPAAGAISLGMIGLPGALATMIVFGGVTSMAQYLSIEREDGTLLRCRALPGGVAGYLTGKVVSVSLMTLLSMLVILLPGLFLIDGMLGNGISTLPTALWVTLLGLLATLPYGAIAGALFTNPRVATGIMLVPIMGLIVISGVFAPIDGFPGWIQTAAQVFPLYWLGLGMRSAFLPDTALAVEIGESWRTLETVGVLGAWAVVGLILAPIVLRRMARRESGAAMEARKHKVMQRVV